ncbi:hypothetical protein A9988_03855 [Acinetobacter calcoaceticus]|nr:hypothetical protein A9988_03855 [Acinetobacter calcoaceticus]
MNTRQLKHFIAVMELRSLTNAADYVHLSESALSRSLKTLEDELKVPLFDRSNRRLQPTAYALEYFERAKRIVFEEREGARTLAMMKMGDYGSLSFGLGSSLAKDLLAPMIQEILTQSPDLKIQSLVESSDVLMNALVKEKLDFFIGDIKLVMNMDDITFEPLFDCSFGWFARANHPLQNKKKIKIEEIQKYKIIGSGYMNENHAWEMSQLYGLTLPMENHYSANTNHLDTVLKLITYTDAIAPSTYIAMLNLLKSNQIIQLDVKPDLKINMTLGIIRLSNRTITPSSIKAFQIIRDYFFNKTNEIKKYRE